MIWCFFKSHICQSSFERFSLDQWFTTMYLHTMYIIHLEILSKNKFWLSSDCDQKFCILNKFSNDTRCCFTEGKCWILTLWLMWYHQSTHFLLKFYGEHRIHFKDNKRVHPSILLAMNILWELSIGSIFDFLFYIASSNLQFSEMCEAAYLWIEMT